MQTLDVRAGETFLPPIEDPPNMIMKLVYAMTRRQFGKVLTPLKVHSARLPIGFAQFYGNIGQLDRKLTLRSETVMLIREHVARINVCTFCLDIGRWFTIQSSMDQTKFDALENYRTDPVFSEKERALLDYVTQLVREKRVDRATFDCLTNHFSEREICEIVYVIASEHVYNMTNIGLNIHSDMLCDIAKARKTA